MGARGRVGGRAPGRGRMVGLLLGLLLVAMVAGGCGRTVSKGSGGPTTPPATATMTAAPTQPTTLRLVRYGVSYDSAYTSSMGAQAFEVQVTDPAKVSAFYATLLAAPHWYLADYFGCGPVSFGYNVLTFSAGSTVIGTVLYARGGCNEIHLLPPYGCRSATPDVSTPLAATLGISFDDLMGAHAIPAPGAPVADLEPPAITTYSTCKKGGV